jgi:lipoprotein-releasing system ATP-binding protein
VARDLYKNFGEVEVLRGVNLSVHEGESLAITGPSGSGKSTLLHLLGTLDAPSSGTVTIDGVAPVDLGEVELARFRNHKIGFVFQAHHLLPQYSLLDNVLVPTWPHGRNTQDALERARSLLDRVELGHRLDHRPSEMSGGECQRAAVARALINEPSVLLCDEPTGNLDREAAAAVSALLFELHVDRPSILIIVTHSAELAARCHRRADLVNGVCSVA